MEYNLKFRVVLCRECVRVTAGVESVVLGFSYIDVITAISFFVKCSVRFDGIFIVGNGVKLSRSDVVIFGSFFLW